MQAAEYLSIKSYGTNEDPEGPKVSKLKSLKIVLALRTLQLANCSGMKDPFVVRLVQRTKKLRGFDQLERLVIYRCKDLTRDAIEAEVPKSILQWRSSDFNSDGE